MNGWNISQHWPVSNLAHNVFAHIIGNSQGMWRASLHTDRLNVYKFGLLLGPSIPDVLQTVGIISWLDTVDTKNLEIRWTLLKTNSCENLIWTASSNSAGVERKFIVHLGPPLFWRTGSTRLCSTHPPGCNAPGRPKHTKISGTEQHPTPRKFAEYRVFWIPPIRNGAESVNVPFFSMEKFAYVLRETKNGRRADIVGLLPK